MINNLLVLHFLPTRPCRVLPVASNRAKAQSPRISPISLGRAIARSKKALAHCAIVTSVAPPTIIAKTATRKTFDLNNERIELLVRFVLQTDQSRERNSKQQKSGRILKTKINLDQLAEPKYFKTKVVIGIIIIWPQAKKECINDIFASFFSFAKVIESTIGLSNNSFRPPAVAKRIVARTKPMKIFSLNKIGVRAYNIIEREETNGVNTAKVLKPYLSTGFENNTSAII